MGFHPGEGRHRGAVDVQRHVALWNEAALNRPGACVTDTQDVLTEGHRIGRGHLLFQLAEEVIDEVQPSVGDEQRVAAVPSALFEQDALNIGGVHRDLGQHREGSARDVDACAQRDGGGVRVIDVAGAITGQ